MPLWEEILTFFFMFDLEHNSYLCKVWIFLMNVYVAFFEQFVNEKLHWKDLRKMMKAMFYFNHEKTMKRRRVGGHLDHCFLM